MRTRARFFVIVGTCLGITTAASAADNGYHGSLCNPATPADNELGYNKFGVYNKSNASSANVSCAAGPPVGSSITKVDVVVYDRHSASDVCCNIYIQKLNGVVLHHSVECSNGFGTMAQTLSYTPPANSVGTVSMDCTIPAHHPANGYSHVTSYRVQTNP